MPKNAIAKRASMRAAKSTKAGAALGLAQALKAAKTLTGARGRVAAEKARKATAATRAAAQGEASPAMLKALKAPVAAPANGAAKYRGIWAVAAEAAAKGKLPAAPDFTAATHAPYRKKLAALVELAKAGDAKGLKAVAINPTSSSPKALARYRDLCLVALAAGA